MRAAAKPTHSRKVSRFKALLWNEYGIDFIDAGPVVKALEIALEKRDEIDEFSARHLGKKIPRYRSQKPLRVNRLGKVIVHYFAKR